MKRICTEEEWKEFKEDVWYDFKKDNNFDELKEAELLSMRLDMLTKIDPFAGKYFSLAWIRKNVLQMNDEDIMEIDEQISKEQAAMAALQPDQGAVDAMGNPIQPQMSTAQAAAQGGAPPMQSAPMPQQGQAAGQPIQEEQPQMPSKFELQPNELELM